MAGRGLSGQLWPSTGHLRRLKQSEGGDALKNSLGNQSERSFRQCHSPSGVTRTTIVIANRIRSSAFQESIRFSVGEQYGPAEFIAVVLDDCVHSVHSRNLAESKVLRRDYTK